MKFRSDEDGFITALRFYKQPNNTGTHVGPPLVGHRPAARGRHLHGRDRVGLAGGEPSRTPCRSRRTRRTSRPTTSSNGNYAFSPGFFEQQGVDRAPMHAPRDGRRAATASTTTARARSPTETFNATNYWVDASFDRTIPPDTRGPVVTESRPPPSATDVAAGTRVTATFDEQLAPASVTSATFTLRDEDGDLVAADVSYDAQTRTAKLKPQSPLANSETYPRALKGGAGGVTDAAGNPLAADKTWSFTTEPKPPGEGPGGPIAGDRRPGRPVRALLRRDPPGRGPQRVRRGGRAGHGDKLAGHDTVILARRPSADAEVGAADDLGPGAAAT